MSKSLIEIDGQLFDATDVTPPPSGREFRNAWTLPVGGVIQIDIVVARQIQRRRVREELLEDWYNSGGPLGPDLTPQDKALDKAPEIDAETNPEELKKLDANAIRVKRGQQPKPRPKPLGRA